MFWPIFSFDPLPSQAKVFSCAVEPVWCLCLYSVALSVWPRLLEATGSVPIQTSPNCPFPRRLISCSDSRGISHTSLVLTDRSARRGIPLWQGTTKRQQSPAARSAHTAQRSTDKRIEKDVKRVSIKATSRNKDDQWWSNHKNPFLPFCFLDGTQAAFRPDDPAVI